MEIEEPVKHGLLLFPPQGVLGQLKKTWHKRYCQLFKASKSGIERLEVWDSHEDYLNPLSSPRIITLEACIKIGSSNQSKVFAVITKTNAYHFGCYTEAESYDWIIAFQQVAFKDDPSSQTIEEDNDLYCTSGEGVFSVKLVETDASKRCGLEPKNYTLIIAAVDMKLMDNDTVLFVWPYRFIRKYGYRDGKFTFDAGRKCESGEGSFKLQHSNQQEIYRCISSKMQSMKKLLRGETAGGVSMPPSSVSSMDLNDAQYHAALSMEAGSRSPLPPTPNLNASNFIDVDFSTASFNSQKPLIVSSSSSNCSLDSLSFIRPPPPIIKPKPAKPPRKYVFSGIPDKKTIGCDLLSLSSCSSGYYRKYNAYSSPEFNRRSGYSGLEEKHNSPSVNYERHPYDIVEVRNNAWKTHGIDTIPHTERINKPPSTSLHEMNQEKGDHTEIRPQRININDTKGVNEVNVNFDDDGDNDQNDDHSDNDDTYKNDNDNDDSHDIIHDNHNNNYKNGESSRHKNDYFNDNEKTDDDLQYETMMNESITTSEITPASPYIHNNIATTSDSTANYDKLQHIGSLYKLDINPGYKTPNQTLNKTSKIVMSTSNNASPIDDSNPSWNDYDIVEDISAIRLADDSNRGYGVIKKKKSPPVPQYKVHNGKEYAVVSKHKKL